jgi:hypothetical protein
MPGSDRPHHQKVNFRDGTPSRGPDRPVVKLSSHISVILFLALLKMLGVDSCVFLIFTTRERRPGGAERRPGAAACTSAPACHSRVVHHFVPQPARSVDPPRGTRHPIVHTCPRAAPFRVEHIDHRGGVPWSLGFATYPFYN